MMVRPADRTARAATLVSQVLGERSAGLVDEGRAAAPARLNINQKYLFRSQPGTLFQFVAKLPTLPAQHSNDKNEARTVAVWERTHAMDADRLYRLQDKIRGDAIAFTKVRGAMEVWYATDDNEIAEYLRERMRSKQGDWQWIYEERPTSTFTLNGEAFPQTPAGFEAARRFALETTDEAESLMATDVGPTRTKRKTATVVTVEEEPISVDDALATLLGEEPLL